MQQIRIRKTTITTNIKELAIEDKLQEKCNKLLGKIYKKIKIRYRKIQQNRPEKYNKL